MDFNNDSLVDLVSGCRSGYVNHFRRLGDGTLTTEPRVQANGSESFDPLNSAPNLVDWTEDGLLDLLLANADQTPRRIRLYLNSGTPEQYVFTDYTELNAGNAPIDLSRMNPHVVDLNGDGKKDLICGEDYSSIYYYENTGTNEAPVLQSGVKLEAEGVPIQFPSGYTDIKVWADDWNEDGTRTWWWATTRTASTCSSPPAQPYRGRTPSCPWADRSRAQSADRAGNRAPQSRQPYPRERERLRCAGPPGL